MPIEIDDESTQFDARPWGAQQRLLPGGSFKAQRMSGTLQETSVPQIPSLPGVAPYSARKAAAAPRKPSRMPVGTPIAPSPVAAAPEQLAHGSNVAPLPVAPLPAMPAPMPVMFSPSIAAAMPVFTAPIDSTFRVHRAAWTLRSFIAVPLGALAAVLLIVIGYRVSSVSMPSSPTKVSLPAAAALSAQPLTAPVLTPDTYTPPVAEGVASFETPAAAEPTLAPAVDEVAKPARKATKKHAATSGKKRPRKIVAVDSSTPLGNLRVKRY